MTAKDYRFQARQALTGNWAIAAGVTLVAMLLGGATSTAADIEIHIGSTETQVTPIPQEMVAQYLPLIIGSLVVVFLAIIALSTLVGGVVNVGYHRFHMNMFDGQTPEFKDLFSHFRKGRYWNTVVMMFLYSIYVIGWMFLFIIPGIIASYSYCMAPYIMIDHPELSPTECLKVSKRMMEGNRWRLFCLQFSFIGWRLLAGLTFGIGSLFLTPYEYSAQTAFYHSICNDIVIEECI